MEDVLSDGEAAELAAAQALSLGAKSPGIGLPADFQVNIRPTTRAVYLWRN